MQTLLIQFQICWKIVFLLRLFHTVMDDVERPIVDLIHMYNMSVSAQQVHAHFDAAICKDCNTTSNLDSLASEQIFFSYRFRKCLEFTLSWLKVYLYRVNWLGWHWSKPKTQLTTDFILLKSLPMNHIQFM